MGVRIAQASINEWGGINKGEPGNQTRTPGKLDGELNVRDWYSKPWTYLIRPKDPEKAEKIADTAYRCVANANVGYDQNDRLTLYYQLKANGFNPDTVGPCECDCSALWADCSISAGINVSPSCYTGNIASVAAKSGEFDVLTDPKYLTTSDYVKRGDALLKPNCHVVIVLDNGSKVDPIIEYKDTYVTTDVLNLRKGPGMNYAVITEIPNRTQVLVGEMTSGSAGNWAQVLYSSYEGYACSDYLEKVDDKDYDPVDKITTDNLSLRKGPGTNYTRLAVIPKGTTIRCSGKTEQNQGVTWWEASYNGYIGYCSGEYLKDVDVMKELHFMTTDSVNMRKTASLVGKVVRVVPKNVVVVCDGTKVETSSRTWYLCSYNGSLGYISNKVLKQI